MVRRVVVGAVPAALVGGLCSPQPRRPCSLEFSGAFLIAPWRGDTWFLTPRVAFRLRALRRWAQCSGSSSAILGSVGPLMAPFFLAYGLLKSAYIGTKAACTLVMHTTKLAVYDGGGVLTNSAVMTGLALAPLTVIGAWIGASRGPHARTHHLLIIEGVLISPATCSLCPVDLHQARRPSPRRTGDRPILTNDS